VFNIKLHRFCVLISLLLGRQRQHKLRPLPCPNQDHARSTTLTHVTAPAPAPPRLKSGASHRTGAEVRALPLLRYRLNSSKVRLCPIINDTQHNSHPNAQRPTHDLEIFAGSHSKQALERNHTLICCSRSGRSRSTVLCADHAINHRHPTNAGEQGVHRFQMSS